MRSAVLASKAGSLTGEHCVKYAGVGEVCAETSAVIMWVSVRGKIICSTLWP